MPKHQGRVGLFVAGVLLIACCQLATAQERTGWTVDTDQVFGHTSSTAKLVGASTSATPQDDLRLQIQGLSAEVKRLRQLVDQRNPVAHSVQGAEYQLTQPPAPYAPHVDDTAFPSPPEPDVNKVPLQGIFDHGWQFRSASGNFVFRPDMEINLDAAWLSADNSVKFGGPGSIGPVTDGINIRRGRFGAKGTIYHNFQYMIQYDFNLAATVRNAGGTGTSVINTPQPTEVFGMFTDLPFVRNIRIGNQKPLWSFENFTSSRFQNFMERSLGWDAFCEDQNNGFIPSIVMLNHTEDAQFVYQFGVAKNNRSGFFYNTQAGNYLVEGRVVFTPFFEDNGRQVLHLGVGGMYADASNNMARFRARTLLRNGANQNHPIMTEARMFADNESRLVPEFVMQLGSFSVQSEYYMAWAGNARTRAAGINSPSLGNWFGTSWYIQANYLLTGEYIPYDRKLGRWGRIVPNENFGPTTTGGWGAWMIGARYSTINLNDLGGVNGAGPNPSGFAASSARVDDVSLAVNWIVNPNARFIFDGIIEHRNAANTPGTSGNVYGFGMRMQVDY